MIDTIIFDYGKVLAYPVTGSWFTTKEFPHILGAADTLRFRFHPARRALEKELHTYLNTHHSLHTEQEEIALFREYYRIIFRAVHIKDRRNKAERLAKDLTENNEKIGIYPDVFPVLSVLKQSYRLLMLTDNWPSVRRVLTDTGLSSLLDGLVISSEHNVCKDEGTALFDIAHREWGVTPQNALFLDDNPVNLCNAEKTGLHPVLVCREKQKSTTPYPAIRSLNELLSLLQYQKENEEEST